MVQKSRKKDLKAKVFSVGIDVHKEKWVVVIYEGSKLISRFSMEADLTQLIKRLKKLCGTSQIQCAYEAGFSGFWLARGLMSKGINCMVVHSSDIPTSDRDRRRKTDKLDSKKIGHYLSRGCLKSIYIPNEEHELLRCLNRSKQQAGKAKRQVMCQIRSFINFCGLPLSKELSKKLWSKKGLKWLEQQCQIHPGLQPLVERYISDRQIELKAAGRICQQIKQSSYESTYAYLMTIPGIGPTTAALLICELGNLNRFPSLNELASYCGLVPDMRCSAESIKILGLSIRGNKRLRTALIESAWISQRYDPHLKQVYQSAISYGKKPQKAIIKVARKLLNKIRAVWIKGQPYKITNNSKAA